MRTFTWVVVIDRGFGCREVKSMLVAQRSAAQDRVLGNRVVYGNRSEI